MYSGPGRTEQHISDTKARKLVAMALPDEWEFREQTGRDYGIDMSVDIFASQGGVRRAIGPIFLQIKGTKKPLSSGKDKSLTIPVRTLYFAELYAAPVLLALCPVNRAEPTFYFLWLQEYIRNTVNVEVPSWRLSKGDDQVTVMIPNGNEIVRSSTAHHQLLEILARTPQRRSELLSLLKLAATMSRDSIEAAAHPTGTAPLRRMDAAYRQIVAMEPVLTELFPTAYPGLRDKAVKPLGEALSSALSNAESLNPDPTFDLAPIKETPGLISAWVGVLDDAEILAALA